MLLRILLNFQGLLINLIGLSPVQRKLVIVDIINCLIVRYKHLCSIHKALNILVISIFYDAQQFFLNDINFVINQFLMVSHCGGHDKPICFHVFIIHVEV